MAAILIIEDDPDVRLLVTRALEHAGHTALFAGSARAGLELARVHAVDLVIVDWRLPDGTGADVVRMLRAEARTRDLPFFFLSALARDADRIAGLELGAEDYLTKPFHVRELVLRVAIALRRHPTRTTLAPPPRVSLPPLEIDVAGAEVQVDGAPVHLTPVELKLLTALAARAGEALSRERLLVDVWGVRPDLETRTIDVHVKRLRDKLGPIVGDALETVRGVGYRYRPARTAAEEP